MADSDSRKRLGRGLAALIGEMDDAVEPVSPKSMDSEVRADRNVPIEHLRANTNNPRKQFHEEHLADLARSISEHGIVQPILVRSVGGADLGGAIYEIIAGERRWRAAQRASLHEVPIIIREVDDKQALELAIIENVQRADLNPVEEALGYQQLIDEYDYTQADLGGVIGKSRSHVANTLRLLKLPTAIQSMVSDGALSAGHARALVTAADPVELANRIVREGLSVRQAEDLCQLKSTDGSSSSRKQSPNKDGPSKSADTKALEKELADLLGLKLDIRHRENGKGEVRIRYRNLDQLEDICARLRK